MVVESQIVGVGVRLYGPSRVDTLVAGRRDTSQLCRLAALMPRLSDDEDVQLFVDDGPTQRRGLVAYRWNCKFCNSFAVTYFQSLLPVPFTFNRQTLLFDD